MFRIFRQSKKRHRYDRISDHSDVRFRIIDSRNPSHRSQLLQGKVLDLSKEGLCIGTSTVQEELHVYHPSLQCKDRLEMEVDLDPCMAPMKTFGEVKWYMQDKNEKGTMFKMGVQWLSLSGSDRQTLNNLLATKMI
jgi:hypothetical protein